MLDDLKPAAAELADLLSTPDGARTLRLLGCTSEAATVDSEEVFRRVAKGRAPSPTAPARVGIWEQREAGAEAAYIRRADLEPLELWAEVEGIPPRDPRRSRVVLLGESCARGLLLDPHFSPAIALARMLSAARGEEVEVIDLARTDQLMLPLLELTRSCLQLQPDAIVVFAGNNWHPAWAFRYGRLPQVGIQLRRERRWAFVRAIEETALAAHVRSFKRALGSIARESGVPIVFVIPEFNLADWRDFSTPPALLSAGDTARWLDLRHDAEEQLRRGEFEQASLLAAHLLDIDGGSTPAGYYILADAAQAIGDTRAVRRHLEAARDVPLFWLRAFSPRLYGVIRDTFLASPPEQGVSLVDLQPLVEEYSSGRLPGRELFHDYCHVTVEGARVSMAPAASRVLEVIGGPRRSWQELAAVAQPVAAEAMAASHVLAATFNASRQQSAEVVRYHLSEALRHHPSAARMLELFIDFHVRRTPAMVCDSLEQLLATTRMSYWHLIFGFGRRPEEKGLNLPLVDECARALSAADPGVSARVRELVGREHGVARGDVDLLDTAYSRTPPIRQMYRSPMAYYRAFEPISTFDLVCGAPEALSLGLTYRSGQSEVGREIRIAVNGTVLHTAPVTKRWRSETFTVEKAFLKPGVNEITIAWPAPDWDLERWIDEIAGLFEANVPAEISPVFGHIHSFRASPRVLSAEAEQWKRSYSEFAISAPTRGTACD